MGAGNTVDLINLFLRRPNYLHFYVSHFSRPVPRLLQHYCLIKNRPFSIAAKERSLVGPVKWHRVGRTFGTIMQRLCEVSRPVRRRCQMVESLSWTEQGDV